MITIGKAPKKLQGFFKPIRDHFTQRPWQHFWALVMAITISHGTTVDRLAKTPRDSTHRTNHGEFLRRSIKPGTVKVVFSRRRGESKHIALVTDDLHASSRTVVAHYLKRWSIEMLIKDQKQHLGLGDYRVLRYQAVVRHLQLVDCAYACLTHMGIKTQCAQGQNKSKKVLRLEPVSKLKERMRRIVWQENVQDVIKYSHEKPVIRRLEKLLAA